MVDGLAKEGVILQFLLCMGSFGCLAFQAMEIFFFFFTRMLLRLGPPLVSFLGVINFTNIQKYIYIYILSNKSFNLT